MILQKWYRGQRPWQGLSHALLLRLGACDALVPAVPTLSALAKRAVLQQDLLLSSQPVSLRSLSAQ